MEQTPGAAGFRVKLRNEIALTFPNWLAFTSPQMQMLDHRSRSGVAIPVCRRVRLGRCVFNERRAA